MSLLFLHYLHLGYLSSCTVSSNSLFRCSLYALTHPLSLNFNNHIFIILLFYFIIFQIFLVIIDSIAFYLPFISLNTFYLFFSYFWCGISIEVPIRSCILSFVCSKLLLWLQTHIWLNLIYDILEGLINESLVLRFFHLMVVQDLVSQSRHLYLLTTVLLLWL